MKLTSQAILDETWIEAFQFSEELETLETPEPMSSQDKNFLDKLSETIAHRLGNQLADPNTLAQYFQIQELKRDNQAMASHIETLVEKTRALESANAGLKKQIMKFKPLLGNLYIKI